MKIQVKHLAAFWEKVSVDPKTGCWNWTGGIQADKGGGHINPKMWLSGKHISTRKFAYRFFLGGRAKMVTCGCQNELCVNPQHALPTRGAFAGTGRTIATGMARKRLDELTVRKILTLRKLGHTYAEIWKKTGIHPARLATVVKCATMCKKGKLKSYRQSKEEGELCPTTQPVKN